jgi:hypothetical protein
MPDAEAFGDPEGFARKTSTDEFDISQLDDLDDGPKEA